ncbi:MAG: right-handed parallel beta-helix repeat-containing protein, partial [Bacteroidota bacterium]|nr:right-handed parallel beta-helix repeat-containing protein [Bacteroidota bacterium]
MKRGWFLLIIIWLLFILHFQTLARKGFGNGHNYYISANGKDDNNGSLQHPWRTIAKLTSVQLQSGDNVHLADNFSFEGTIYLHNQSGKKAAPIIIKSGKNKSATIKAKDSSAIVLDSCSYISIHNIIAVGSGRKEGNTNNGIVITNSTNIAISHATIEGFQKAGLLIHNCNSVVAENTTAHDNGFAGIHVMGQYGDKLHCRNVRLLHCKAYNNPGDPTILNNHSGNGILAGFCTH